ncbi:FKBP-type peptidyl-prolyl cis-trans isomerase [Hymenobacter sp. UYCo722]|uniref:FKBP-type peptidyl-prolyl cis-trans isomerase n=1 Tax=Hymenobacter sp. UYCo722 TaxID=3156335 RepID=UPI00339B4971
MNTSLLRTRHWLLAALLLLAIPTMWSCNSKTTLQKQLSEHQDQLKQIDDDTIQSYLRRNNLLAKATKTNSGLYVVNLVDGTGTTVKAGDRVRMKYIGRVLSNGAHPSSTGYPASPGDSRFPQGVIFDNSADKNTQCGCAVFVAGTGLAPGFYEGLLLMRVGDRKLLLLPSRLGYGPSGYTDPNTRQVIVPSDSALLFDVEILGIQ